MKMEKECYTERYLNFIDNLYAILKQTQIILLSHLNTDVTPIAFDLLVEERNNLFEVWITLDYDERSMNKQVLIRFRSFDLPLVDEAFVFTAERPLLNLFK